jgi:hypothetical protein
MGEHTAYDLANAYTAGIERPDAAAPPMWIRTRDTRAAFERGQEWARRKRDDNGQPIKTARQAGR